MKRILPLLLVLMLLIACVPTPEEESVREKNTEALIELAVQTPDAVNPSPATRTDVPERYTAELISTVGQLSVTVDAPVIVPDCALPLARIAPSDFSVTLIRSFANVLFGEDAHYFDPHDVDNLTKGYYTRHVADLMDALDHWDEYGSVKYDLVYETKADAQKALDKLSKKAAAAPDSMPAYTPDFSDYLKPENNGLYWVFAMQENDVHSRMDVSHMAGITELCYWRDADYANSSIFPDPANVNGLLTCTEDEAVRQAQTVLKQVGLDDFVCVKHYGMNAVFSSESIDPCYLCVFMRCLNGAPITYANNGTAAAQYDQTWRQERIFVEIDDGGVRQLIYESPLSVLDMLSEQSRLLPFSEIADIFERRITVVNNTTDFLEDKKFTERYVITEIRLGLVEIREEDRQTGLLVPAWDFLGYSERTNQNGVTESYPFDSSYSFLTINAVDGSIISRNVGY